jgi:hypothetical protein
MVVMKARSIAVVTDNQTLWRRIGGPLASAGSQLYWVRKPAAAIDLMSTTPVDLALVDPLTVPDLAQVRAAAGERCQVVAIAAGATAPVVAAWRGAGAGGLIARLGEQGEVEADFDPADILITAGKLLRGELFGLEKHLSTFGGSIESRVVSRADQRDGVLDALSRLAEHLHLGPRRTRLIRDVADELVTNAIYDAPRDADGRPRYLNVDRRDKLVLEPTEYVTVRYGADGRMFGLSVTDGFGGLDPARLASCMVRAATRSAEQIEQKQGGAGLGLYLALRSADHLVIASAPGRRTEITALWRLDHRAPGAVATLSYLTAPAEPAEVAAVVPSVELSHSARVEITCELAESARVAAEDDGAIDRTIVVTSFHEESSRPEIDLEWAWDPLAELRGVHLLRQSEPPGLDTTIARLRGMTSPAQILSAATAYLIADWHAAIVLEVDDEALRPICLAGDVAEPDALRLVALSRRGPSALAYLANQSGMMLGPLTPRTEEAALSIAMCGEVLAEGLALALPVGLEVRYLVFAVRPRGRGFAERGDHQRLLREITVALARAERQDQADPGGDSAVH